MNMAEECVRPSIDEFKGEIFAREGEEVIVAHAQGVFSAVAFGIPCVDGSHGARIGSYERGEDKRRRPSSPRRDVTVESMAFRKRRKKPLHSQR